MYCRQQHSTRGGKLHSPPGACSHGIGFCWLTALYMVNLVGCHAHFGTTEAIQAQPSPAGRGHNRGVSTHSTWFWRAWQYAWDVHPFGSEYHRSRSEMLHDGRDKGGRGQEESRRSIPGRFAVREHGEPQEKRVTMCVTNRRPVRPSFSSTATTTTALHSMSLILYEPLTPHRR